MMKYAFLLFLIATTAQAADLTVGPRGFATIGAGVQALKPGDTLTIAPGEYRETVTATLVGTPEAPIVIRAARAGSVLLHGDVELDQFKPASGLRHVFVTELKQRAESVFERSTFRTLEPKLSVAEVELSLPSYFHDEQNGLLYVHTSDSLPPQAHAIAASVTNSNGLLLSNCRHVVVEGLAFTGFSHRDYDVQHGSRTRWGLLLKDAEHCTVRRCVAYLNSGGIHLLGGGQQCVVEDCEAFGNWSRHVDIGNNIVGWGVAGTTFRRNRVEGHMPDSGTSRNDITFYSGGNGCAMLDNLAINASVMIKGGMEDAVQRGNVCVGRKYYRAPGTENVELATGPTAADVEKYADVLNHDYRTDRVWFVSPRGDDANPGTKARPFKTIARAMHGLPAADTIYLLGGEYSEPLVATSNADVRRYGHDRVIVQRVELRGARNVRLHGLHIAEDVAASDCENLQIDFCVLPSLRLEKSPNFRLAHNGLRESLHVIESRGGSLVSNVMRQQQIDAASQDGLWTHSNVETPFDSEVLPSDSPWDRLPACRSPINDRLEADSTNSDRLEAYPTACLIGRGLHASTVGPYLRLKVLRPLPIDRAIVRDVTTTTATLEWSTPTQAVETTLEWGESKISTPRASHHSVSLIGLKPGTSYSFRVTSLRRDEQRVFATHQPRPNLTQAAVESQSLTTATERNVPRTLHVPGDFKTISEAAEVARAGDTVLIHSGVYSETVRIRATGDEGAPITFQAAPGEVVWIDGSNRFRANAFVISNKHHIVLDGLRFQHFRFAPELGTMIGITGGSKNVIRRCFHDGREIEGYVGTLIGAAQTKDLLVENCVMINGMGEAITANGCPDLTVRHCVFYNNFIRALTAQMTEPTTLFHFHHNLVCDSIPSKVNNPLLRLGHVDALRSDHNVFFTRIPGEQRRIVEAFHKRGEKVGHEVPGSYRGEDVLLGELRSEFGQDKQSRHGNPGILATPRLVPRNDADESEWRRIEMHRIDNGFEPFDFKDFIPAADNPLAKAADGKPVGLDPGAFAR
jgi:parallel beta-helix repeat protein